MSRLGPARLVSSWGESLGLQLLAAKASLPLTIPHPHPILPPVASNFANVVHRFVEVVKRRCRSVVKWSELRSKGSGLRAQARPPARTTPMVPRPDHTTRMRMPRMADRLRPSRCRNCCGRARSRSRLDVAGPTSRSRRATSSLASASTRWKRSRVPNHVQRGGRQQRLDTHRRR
jgi:hypothetical protein